MGRRSAARMPGPIGPIEAALACRSTSLSAMFARLERVEYEGVRLSRDRGRGCLPARDGGNPRADCQDFAVGDRPGPARGRALVRTASKYFGSHPSSAPIEESTEDRSRNEGGYVATESGDLPDQGR